MFAPATSVPLSEQVVAPPPPPPPPPPPTETATSVTMRATSGSSGVGDAVRLGAYLESLGAIRMRMPGELLILEASRDGGSFAEIARGTTDANGDLFIDHVFVTEGVYLIQARYQGRDTFLPDTSNVITHTVGAAPPPPSDIVATLVLSTSPNPSLAGATVTCSGRLTRNDTGAGVAGSTVQVFVNGSPVSGATAVTDSTGGFSIALVFTIDGSYQVQAESTEVIV